MKRFFVLALCLAMALSLSPAMAAEPPAVAELFPTVRTYKGFSDVAETAWYAPYVKLCYEAGLLNGSGNGMFNPTTEMTAGEAEALAARLHYALNGRKGALPKAPAGTGSFRVTLPDGSTEVTDYGCGGAETRIAPHDFTLYLGTDNYEVLGAPASLVAVIDGVCRVEGQRLPLHRSPNAENVIYEFAVSDAVFATHDPVARLYGNWNSRDHNMPDSQLGAWFWDADLYLKGLPSANTTNFEANLEMSCSRGSFLSILNLVCPETLLPAINHVTVLPDTARADVLRFYNAGILTGNDAQGTFAYYKGLTRGEAAAMLARILQPELRLPFTAKQDGLPYTLKELPITIGYEDRYLVRPQEMPEQLSPLLNVAPLIGSHLGPRGLMDWNGNWVVPMEYDGIDAFLSDGLARVEQGDLYGYIDSSGKTILPCKYPLATRYHDGVLVVGDGEKPFAAYDTTSKKLGELPADVNYNNTSEGFIQYHDAKTGKFGYLNADGSIALKAAYDQVYPVSRHLAPVGIGGKLGFVNFDGDVVVPLRYDSIISGFGKEGLAVVGSGNTEPSPLHYNGKMGMVDTKGNEVIPMIYDFLRAFSGGKAQFVRGDVTGDLLPDGTEVVTEESSKTQAPQPDLLTEWLHFTRPHNYTLVSEIRSNQAIVQLGESYYLLTLNQ
ncbi:MAG: WG repeat-containing protein [Oscillospiraceae bacterium]